MAFITFMVYLSVAYQLIMYLPSRYVFMYPCSSNAAVYPQPSEHIVSYSPFFFLFLFFSSRPQVV